MILINIAKKQGRNIIKKLFLLLICLFTSLSFLCARDITTTSGKVYHKVKVIQVTPEGIEMSHSGGIIYLKFKNLPKGIQQEFGYSLEKEKIYKKQLKQKRNKAIAIRKEEAQKKNEKLAAMKKARKEQEDREGAKKQRYWLDGEFYVFFGGITRNTFGGHEILGNSGSRLDLVPVLNNRALIGERYYQVDSKLFSPANSFIERLKTRNTQLESFINESASKIKALIRRLGEYEKELRSLLIQVPGSKSFDVYGDVNAYGYIYQQLSSEQARALSQARRNLFSTRNAIIQLQNQCKQASVEINSNNNKTKHIQNQLQSASDYRKKLGKIEEKEVVQRDQIPIEEKIPNEEKEEKDIEKRLIQLNKLRDNGLITEKEYKRKRDEIIAEL